LQLGVGGKEAACVDGTEEVGVEYIFGAMPRLCDLEEKGETSVLVVLLVSVA
jgi:hypothetical protein